jgi:hypothetical protein
MWIGLGPLPALATRGMHKQNQKEECDRRAMAAPAAKESLQQWRAFKVNNPTFFLLTSWGLV